jgi:hypothetical protein
MVNIKLSEFEVDGKPINEDGLLLQLMDKEHSTFGSTPFIHDGQFFVNVLKPAHSSDKLLQIDGTTAGAAYRDSKPTGWFTSLSEVRAAVRLYRQLNSQPQVTDNGEEEACLPSIQETFVKPYNTQRPKATDNWPSPEAYRKAGEAVETSDQGFHKAAGKTAQEVHDQRFNPDYKAIEERINKARVLDDAIASEDYLNEESLPPQTSKTESFHNDESHSE